MQTKHIVGQITKAADSAYDGTFILSTDSVDRYGDVIEQSGWDLENFKRNPVALWMHDQRNPIGVWHNIRIETNRLVADLKLASTNLARLAKQLIDDGVLRAVSVGFLPKEANRLDEKNPSSGYLIKAAELLEVSLVSVPANQDALMIAKSLGLTDDELATVFDDPAPPAGKSADPALLERARSLLSGKSAGITPKSTDTHEDKPMTLSERIQAKQKEMVALRDELAMAAEKYAEEPTDENRETVEAFTGQIESTEKQLSTLEAAEKNLMSAATRSQPAQAPAVVQSVKNYDAGELIVRQAVVSYLAHEQHKSTSEVIRERYRNDKGLEAIMTKAAAAPGDTTTSAWAASLLDDQVAGFVDLLANNSVYGALRAVGMSLNFSGYGSIKIPSRTSTKTPAGGFVGEGGAIPVKELSFTSQTLTRHKMGVIVTMTDELADATNGQIETIVRQAILDETSKALDAILLDTSASSTTRPVGLLNGVTHPASAGDSAANIIADLKTLLSAFQTDDAGKNLRILINPQRLLGAATAVNAVGEMQFAEDVRRGVLMGIPFIVSANVQDDEVICINAGEFVTAYDGPQFSVSNTATLHMEDTSPTAIGTAGSPNAVAAPVRSLFQTNVTGIKMVLPVTWAMRRDSQISMLDTVAW